MEPDDKEKLEALRRLGNYYIYEASQSCSHELKRLFLAVRVWLRNHAIEDVDSYWVPIDESFIVIKWEINGEKFSETVSVFELVRGEMENIYMG